MKALGFDIGGANIKVSNGVDWHQSIPFELWRQPNELSSTLTAMLGDCPAHDRIAVTMTGELCDCFPSKRAGVEHILENVKRSLGAHAQIYLLNGQFVSTDVALANWRITAAANWHAIGTWAARLCPNAHGCAFDIGSTTSDIIPFSNGKVDSASASDLDRLLAGELIYTGVARTPVSTVCPKICLRGRQLRLAAEPFATMLDVCLILGLVAEKPSDCNTADGRPAIRNCALQRLARALCSDLEELSMAELLDLAEQIISSQASVIHAALTYQIKKTGPASTIVVSGSGEWLAAKISAEFSSASVLRWSDHFDDGLAASSAAAAAAIACLVIPESLA